MSGRKTSSETAARRHQVEALPPTATDAGHPLSPEADPFLRTQYQSLTRKHLDGLCEGIFAEFTGLRFHVAWAPSLPGNWDASTLPRGCGFCRHSTGVKTHAEKPCSGCGPKRLARSLTAGEEGHQFTCPLGVRNYWLPIRVRGLTVGLAYLRARAGKPSPASARKRPVRLETKSLTRSEFRRAGKLLRLIIQYVETQDLAQLRFNDLSGARQALTALVNEQARLHRELGRGAPQAAEASRAAQPESHPEQLVRAALEIINENYSRPLTLTECASRLRLNASYLSDLFSRVVKVPFKTFLTELRLAKAKHLLADPARNITEVALATGYISENRFRAVFKRATGLSPKIWRKTFHLVKVVLLTALTMHQEFLANLEQALP